MKSLLKRLPDSVELIRRAGVRGVRGLSSVNDIKPSELTMDREDNISSQILTTVSDLVQKHKLISDKFDLHEKVVEFEHPEDLFKLLPLEISKLGCSDAELKSIR